MLLQEISGVTHDAVWVGESTKLCAVKCIDDFHLLYVVAYVGSSTL